MNPPYIFTSRRKQLRLAMHIIRRYLKEHPGTHVQIGQQHARTTYLTYLETAEGDTIIYTSGHWNRGDAIISAANELTTEKLPAMALWVVLDWLKEHELADLTLKLKAPSSIDDAQQWEAYVGVPVQFLAQSHDWSASDAIAELAYRVTKLPENVTESI